MLRHDETEPYRRRRLYRPGKAGARGDRRPLPHRAAVNETSIISRLTIPMVPVPGPLVPASLVLSGDYMARGGISIILVITSLALAGCGVTPGCRAASTGMLGAGTGAAIAAIEPRPLPSAVLASARLE